MSKKLYNESSVQNIANAIRTFKEEVSTIKYKIADMATAISGFKKTLTVNITNGTIIKGSDAVFVNNIIRIIITPNSGYKLPDDVTVTNATKSYNKLTGILEISIPTDNVTVTIDCPTEAFDPTAADWYNHTDLCKESDIGIETTISINGVDHHLRLIGIDHDDLADGTGKAHTTWQLVELMSDSSGATLTQKWNASYTDPYFNIWNNGTQSCDIRNYLRTTFKGYLPTDLQSKIKTIKKKTSAGNESTTVNELEEDIFLLSVKEICSDAAIQAAKDASHWGTSPDVLKQEGNQYKFFADNLPDTDPYNWDSTLTDAQKAIVIKKDKSGAAYSWWLRSPDVDRTYYAFYVGSTGRVYYYYVYYANGVAPAFCI